MATTQGYGYQYGQPFGDPNKFTRSTQESEVDRFNDWMRTTPEWQQARGTSTGDFNDQQAQTLMDGLAKRGIVVPKDFHIDEGGNFNQKSRVKRNLAIAGLIAAGALTAGGAAGFGPMAGLMGGGAATTGGAAAAGSVLPSTTIGTGMMGGIAGGTGLAGATGAGAGLLGATAIGSGMMPAIAGGTGLTGGTSMGLGSTIANLAKSYGKNLLSQQGSEGLSKALSSGSQAMANNRGTMAELQLDQNSDLERQLIAREQEKRAARNDAYKNAVAGERMMSWTPLARPAGITGSYAGLTDAAKANGQSLYNMAKSRLASPDLTNDQGMPAYRNLMQDPEFQKTLKPGFMERATGVGSYALPFISKMLGRQ